MHAEVIYEDNHLIAVNKPAGLLTQGDKTGDVTLSDQVKQYIKEKYHKPGAVFLGVVHRLDRPVSGVVVLARTSKALSRMNELFRERETVKIYWAVTAQRPPRQEANLVHWLKKDEAKNRTTVFPRETPGALRSELHYRLIKSISGRYLLEVTPLTGRSHQIRAQLAAAGMPIFGDLKYGASDETGDGSIALHSRRLEFVHPVRNEPVKLLASLPKREWWSGLD